MGMRDVSYSQIASGDGRGASFHYLGPLDEIVHAEDTSGAPAHLARPLFRSKKWPPSICPRQDRVEGVPELGGDGPRPSFEPLGALT